MKNNNIEKKDNKNSNDNNDINSKDNKQKENNIKNDEDIEMEDNYNINNNSNQCNFTQTDIHIKNNIFENIGKVEFRRMTEIPKSNYNLNYNCDNATKTNGFYNSNIKNNIIMILIYLIIIIIFLIIWGEFKL